MTASIKTLQDNLLPSLPYTVRATALISLAPHAHQTKQPISPPEYQFSSPLSQIRPPSLQVSNKTGKVSSAPADAVLGSPRAETTKNTRTALPHYVSHSNSHNFTHTAQTPPESTTARTVQPRRLRSRAHALRELQSRSANLASKP